LLEKLFNFSSKKKILFKISDEKINEIDVLRQKRLFGKEAK